jgi:hypothetical protein
MVNKKFLLGILVLALVFGMTVVSCEEEDESKPYLQSIQINVTNSTWNSSTPTSGSVEIWFQPPVPAVNVNYTGTPAKVSVEDLQWLQVSGINLELFNAGGRTVSITSIEKTEDSDGRANKRAFVKLNLTRSAQPSGGSSGTATVLITLPNNFSAKYPDGITWGNKTFTF